MSLLLVVFLVELAVHVINSIGASTINNLLWNLVNTFPTRISRDVAEQRKLQKEYLAVRRDLKATSSQDQFAKWARLRRQHDKLLEQLEKKRAVISTHRTRLDASLTVVRLLLTYVIKFGLPIWYARTPLFWLPYGWLPYYAEWLVSFPLAPLGSVSVWTWRVACAAVIRMAWDTGIALVGLVVAAERGGGTRLTKKSQEEKEKEKAAPPATADGPNEAQGKGKAES